jgi:cobalamin biosynthesis protein CbiD
MICLSNNRLISNNNSNINLNPDKKSSITIAIRVRPLNQTELQITSVEGIKIVNSNSLIVSSDPNSINKKTNLIKEHQIFFDYVFGQSSI